MIRRIVYCLIGMVVSGGISHAQYIGDALRYSQLGLGVGGQTIGLAGTSVGIGNDISALFSNPAGLTQIHNNEFSVGLSEFGSSNDVSFFGDKATATNNAFMLNDLGLVYPVATKRGGLTFAIGLGRIADFTSASNYGGYNIEGSFIGTLIPTTDLSTFTSAADLKNYLDNNIPFQLWLADTLGGNNTLYPILTDSLDQRVNILESGGLNNISFGGGIAISPRLSLGVSLNFIYGTHTYDRLYVEADTKNVYNNSYGFPWNVDRFEYDSTAKNDINGFNALFGLMFAERNKYRIGLTVRTPTIYEVNQNTTQSYDSYFKTGDHFYITDSYSQKYTVTTPLVLSGGFSVQPVEWLMLAGDGEYTDWSQLEMNADDPVLDAELQSENRMIKSTLRATTKLRGGAEISLLDFGIKIRGGMSWNPSPYIADESTTDYDQFYYTAGLGIQLDENTTIDFTYALGYTKYIRSTYPIFDIVGALQTSENINSKLFNVSLTYRL